VKFLAVCVKLIHRGLCLADETLSVCEYERQSGPPTDCCFLFMEQRERSSGGCKGQARLALTCQQENSTCQKRSAGG
jgi:hypothetical protein